MGIRTVSASEIFGDYNSTNDNMGIRMKSAYEFVNECLLPKGRVQVTDESEPCDPQWLLRSKCMGNGVNADPTRTCCRMFRKVCLREI